MVSISTYLKTLKSAQIAKDAEALSAIKVVLHGIVPELKAAEGAKKDLLKVIISPEQMKLIKHSLSQDALEVIKIHKLANIETTKTSKEIFYNFFGMNDSWPLGRNLLGGFMVHCPEYPTYFIPAYTQAKSTGDASDLKKGEGPRGLITGGLEGIAVGALVSGRFLKPKEMVPYIILGAGLQLFSCKVFPWLGEKVGQYQYNKKLLLNAQNPTKQNDAPPKELSKPIQKANAVSPKFQGRNQYGRQNIFSPSSLKI